MIFAFAPLVALLPSFCNRRAVGHAAGVGGAVYRPAGIAGATVAKISAGAEGDELVRTLHNMHPLSLLASHAIPVLLFAFQGREIVAKPLIIAILEVPITIQVFSTQGWRAGSTGVFAWRIVWQALRH